MRKTIAVLSFALAIAAAGAARADVTQPNGTRIPTAPGCDGGNPTGLLPTFACVCDEPDVCNIGERCDPGLPGEDCPDLGQNATCESRMWHQPNDDPCIPAHHDGLDPIADASVTPETFVPTCPLTFTVVTRGTAIFHNAFGWYNVTGSAPAREDLHVMLACDDAAGSSAVLDVRNDPAWQGGEIGFFLLTPEDRAKGGTCANGDCCASLGRYAEGVGYVYYSERGYNPERDDFVHLLVYDSQAWARRFYFAWEDTFNAPNNDFTDLVTGVEGVECAGAGVDCDTGDDGVCEYGVLTCEGPDLVCQPQQEAQDERCNGVDDDCDGDVDEDVTCPGQDEICVNGACVPDCAVAEEFACPIGYECDNDAHRCIEEACRDVDCPAGEVCRGGDCGGPCDGVVCPHDRWCTGDRCVDLCANASCAPGDVCDRGVCLPGCNQCNGIVCAAGLGCDDASGECVDRSCGDPCGAGEYCSAGECHDACEGAVCPPGQSCTDGECVDGAGGDGDGDGDGDGGGVEGGGGDASCACRTAPSRITRGSAALLLGIYIVFVLRRRRF